MNKNAQSEPNDPLLLDLIERDNTKVWNEAWKIANPKLYAISLAVVRKAITGISEDIVAELHMRSIQEFRNGLEILRFSKDPEKGVSWKKLKDFAGARKLFAKIVSDNTTDYCRKHGREVQYEDQLEREQAPNWTIFDLEWYETFGEATEKLRPIDRDLLRGRILKGLETEDQMKIHSLPAGTVSGNISRAKKELLNIIQRNPKFAEILSPKQLKLQGG